MSLNVLIGSHDLSKINDTVQLLKFIESLLENKTVFQLPEKQYTSDDLESLIDWYKSLYNLISTSGNEEDVELTPV